MKWNTAAKYCAEDGHVITHLYYGDRIHIPPINRDRRVQLVSHEHDVLGEVAVHHQRSISRPLKRCFFTQDPLTGWVPGYAHWSSRYHNPQFYASLLDMTRQLAAHSGQEEVSIADLRSTFAADQRLLMLHLFNLVEDWQGLVAVGTPYTHVRLATWRQAIAPRFLGNTILPEAQLRLSDDLFGRDWSITTTRCDPLAFRLMLYDKPLTTVTGTADQIDQRLQEEGLPQGWAATYGENCSQMQHVWEQVQAQSSR